MINIYPTRDTIFGGGAIAHLIKLLILKTPQPIGGLNLNQQGIF